MNEKDSERASYMTDASLSFIKRWSLKEFKIYMYIALFLAVLPIFVQYAFTYLEFFVIHNYYFGFFKLIGLFIIIIRIYLIGQLALFPKSMSEKIVLTTYYNYIYGFIYFTLESFSIFIFPSDYVLLNKIYYLEYFNTDKDLNMYYIFLIEFIFVLIVNIPDIYILKKLNNFLAFNYDDGCEFDENDFMSSKNLSLYI